MTAHRFEFSVWDAVDALEGDDGNAQRSSRDRSAEKSEWAGCTLDEARRYARHGWEQGAAQVSTRPSGFRVDEVPSFEYALAEEGGEPDVAAFLSGEPDCMGDFRRLPLPRPLVRVGVDMSVSSNVSATKMLAVGRSTVLCVERLRAMGLPAAVDAVMACMGGGDDTCEVVLRVQEPDQPVHAGVLAFFCGHPGSLRRAAFALAETLPAAVRRAFGFYSGGSYGYPIAPPSAADYDELAPSANAPQSEVDAWVASVVERRRP